MGGGRTAKKGTNRFLSRCWVLGFADLAHAFLNARISSRVIDFAPPVNWNT